MATRSAFLDDSYQMYRMDNVLDSVNLNVIGWNRATVADGQWLQDNAIGPLSARDMYLADCIDEAWGSINNIRQTLADMGAETTGVNLVGFTMKSLNVAQCSDPDAAYTDNNLGWKAKHTSLVTSGAGDTFMTPASLSYLSIGNQAENLGEVAQTLAADQYGGILQINTTAKDAYQMAFTPSGIYYRHISPSDGTAQTQVGDKGDFTFMDSPPEFSALPLGAMTEQQIDAKLAGYLTTNAAQTTYLKQSDAATTYQTIAGMNSYYTTGQTSAASEISDALALKADKSEIPTTVAQLTDSGDYLTTADASLTYLTTADASVTYLTEVRINNDLSGNGTVGNELGIAAGAVEGTIIQLTSAGTNRQDLLSTWLQRIIDAIAAIQPQQQQEP